MFFHWCNFWITRTYFILGELIIHKQENTNKLGSDDLWQQIYPRQYYQYRCKWNMIPEKFLSFYAPEIWNNSDYMFCLFLSCQWKYIFPDHILHQCNYDAMYFRLHSLITGLDINGSIILHVCLGLIWIIHPCPSWSFHRHWGSFGATEALYQILSENFEPHWYVCSNVNLWQSTADSNDLIHDRMNKTTNNGSWKEKKSLA